MSLKNRLISIIFSLLFLILMIYIAMTGKEREAEKEAVKEAKKETIRIWYADAALTDYINSAALTFYDTKDVRVETKLVAGTEYLEAINKETLTGSEMPDLYIIGNDYLGKAYMSGLATQIGDDVAIVNSSNYSKAALDAVTFHDKYVAYPFYCETSYLLFNKSYLMQIAKQVVLDEIKEATGGSEEEDIEYMEGMEPEDTTEVEITPEIQALIDEKYQTMVPRSIEDIMNYANEYDAPEGVEAIFKWDVSDIFYNYFFVGAYANVGGDTGDDPSLIDIYNESAIQCLEVYQQLNEFFYIEADTVSYESVIQEFIEGKLIFTVATTDAIAKIEQAISAGEFTQEYGVLKIPDINDEIKTRSLSTTHVVAINSYSEKQDIANEFAKLLTFDSVESLYTRTGKAPAKMNVNHPYEAMEIVLAEYAQSISMPKLPETGNYWVEMELCFTKAWVGEDVNLLLKALSEKMKGQITGTVVEETYIVMPEKGDEEILDAGDEIIEQ